MKAAFQTTYEVLGAPDAPPLVLVHGLGLNRHMWQWMRPALAETHRVITYDLCGHGDTPMPDAPASLDLFAAQLHHMLGEMDINSAAIAGFSLGGMIARKFAQTYPRQVQALCILHSPHQRTKAAQSAIEARVEQARDAGAAATVDAAIDRWFTPRFRAEHPEVINEVRTWVLGNDPQIYPSNYAVLAHGVTEIIAPQPSITAPALVMTADEDFGNGPEMTHAIAAEIPGAKQVILPGLRHMAPVEAPQKTAEELRHFLDSLQDGRLG